MQRRALTALLGAGLVAGVAMSPAVLAGPKDPIEESYEVTAPVPMPVPPTGPACSMAVDGVTGHVEGFTAPAPGTLTVEMTGYVGDWDLVLRSGGKDVAASNGDATAPVEKVKYKVKKAGKIDIATCNFSGGPTAAVKYTFVFNK